MTELLALLAAVIVPAGESFRCTPARVWDGDGPIWCAEGPRLRIADIAARELDGSCRRGHPCPKASGIKARDVLVELLGGSRGTTRDGHVIVAGPPMQCRSRGPDRYRRTVAVCYLPTGEELGACMVKRAAAARWFY